jgi:hypothetical protein
MMFDPTQIDFEVLACDHCGKPLALVRVCDLEGSYFYCDRTCGEAGEQRRFEARKRLAKHLAKVKSGEIKPGKVILLTGTFTRLEDK